MKVTLITVSLNPGRSIKTAIESVLSQHYDNIEYIIMDGGSTDGSLELIKSYNGHISSLHSEADRGMYYAMNHGIQLASGDVIGFVHSDDLLADPYVVSEVVRAFKESQADAVYGDIVYVSKHDANKIVRYWKSGHFKPEKLKYGWSPPHTALYIKKDVYENEKLSEREYYDTSLRIASDYDFMVRILKGLHLKTYYIPRVLAKMRLGGISNSGLKNMVLKSREDYTAIRRHKIGGIKTLLSKNIRKIPQFIKV